MSASRCAQCGRTVALVALPGITEKRWMHVAYEPGNPHGAPHPAWPSKAFQQQT